MYCERFGSLYQKWLDEVRSTRGQEEHFSVSGALCLEQILCRVSLPSGRAPSCSRSGGKGQDVSSRRQGEWLMVRRDWPSSLTFSTSPPWRDDKGNDGLGVSMI